MGNRGRFGKYGEIKRIARLRQAGKESAYQKGTVRGYKAGLPFSGRQAVDKGRLRIRVGRKSDMGFMIDLSGRTFSRYGPYEKIIEQWLESGMTLAMVSLHGKRPVGFAMINLLPEEMGPQYETELLAIALEPDMHRRGIGLSLLRSMEQKARESGIRTIVLHTARENLAARGLFKKAGFAELGIKKGFYPNGQDALVMIKEISPPNSPHHQEDPAHP
ncbi:MAG: GNAT family N-acetyltransferase [Deltaproteobacteria bacterium]|nr:GNAT family N-acetyltransferase [Deltaproteobacteria bacterium]